MADPAGETIVGVVPATLKLPIGTERLSLYITRERIIVAKVGKRVAGSAAAFPALSGLSGIFESLFKRRGESNKKKKARKLTLTPDLILKQDKGNFPIGYDEIVSVELIESPSRTGITILTRDDKMFFITPTPFETIASYFRERLGSRLTVKRLPEVATNQESEK